MEEIIVWWQDNWWWCVPLVITEVLPFVRNTDANGMLHALASIIQKAAKGPVPKVMLMLAVMLAAGCTTIYVTPPAVDSGGTLNITVDASRTVTTNPSIKADGNQVPLVP